jgi:hypothetical protein
MSKKHEDGNDINSTAAQVRPSNDGYGMTDQDLDCALLMLLREELIRPAGLRNGEIVYVCTPDSELSDKAKALAAYLDGLGRPVSSNEPGVVMWQMNVLQPVQPSSPTFFKNFKRVVNALV